VLLRNCGGCMQLSASEMSAGPPTTFGSWCCIVYHSRYSTLDIRKRVPLGVTLQDVTIHNERAAAQVPRGFLGGPGR